MCIASTKETVRRLRHHGTRAERMLWRALRDRKIGFKWRRQYPIIVDDGERKWAFIADFFCVDHQLVIELDGSIHDNQREYDTARTAAIEMLGLKVVRFTNRDIIHDLDSVIARIVLMCKTTDNL